MGCLVLAACLAGQLTPAVVPHWVVLRARCVHAELSESDAVASTLTFGEYVEDGLRKHKHSVILKYHDSEVPFWGGSSYTDNSLHTLPILPRRESFVLIRVWFWGKGRLEIVGDPALAARHALPNLAHLTHPLTPQATRSEPRAPGWLPGEAETERLAAAVNAGLAAKSADGKASLARKYAASPDHSVREYAAWLAGRAEELSR